MSLIEGGSLRRVASKSTAVFSLMAISADNASSERGVAACARCGLEEAQWQALAVRNENRRCQEGHSTKELDDDR
jgi:hypothetical protein